MGLPVDALREFLTPRAALVRFQERPACAGQPPEVATPDPAEASPPSLPVLGPGITVLQIGDSHTVGAFGTEMDRLLRATGARVETRGVAASSPRWWLEGTTTRCGFVARHADGMVEEPPWREPHPTPLLADLLAWIQPDLVIVNLGANLRAASPARIRAEVEALAGLVRGSGARLAWVGPPRTREDMEDPAPMAAFNSLLAATVAPFGPYVESARFTEYAGRDGIHYSGEPGLRKARAWAAGVVEELRKLGR